MQNANLVRHLESYADYHRHPMNIACHKVGIPLVVFNTVAMLGWLRPFGIPLSLPLYVAVILWYAALDRRLAKVMAVGYAVCIIARWVAAAMLAAAPPAAGWIRPFGRQCRLGKTPAPVLPQPAQPPHGPQFFAAALPAPL